MKILRIIARLNIGGPARNAVLLSEGLDYYKTVLICGEVEKYEGDMMYLAKEKKVEPIIIRELGRELSFGNDWRAFWKIYRVICREKPGIIHTHTAKAGTLGRSAGILYNLTHRNKCRLVHTFHGHVLHSYFGKIKTLFFIWIEKILSLFTDKIVTVSWSLKKELVERFRIAPAEKFSVIELGFELDDLTDMPPVRENPDCVNIGIVGRLAPVKNHRMLFNSAKMLKDLDSGLRFKIFVIGDGESRDELERYVKECGIDALVEFKGWIRDLRGIYEGLDIVALTSLNEGTPVSIIESMVAARPVIATGVGGVCDIVQHGKNGYLVESNNEKDFADKVLDLIKDAGKRKRFGEYGREAMKKRFSKDRLLRDTEDLYRAWLTEKK